MLEAEGQKERDSGRFYAEGFEGGRRRCVLKAVGSLEKVMALRRWKSQGTDSPLEPPKGASPADTLTLTQ